MLDFSQKVEFYLFEGLPDYGEGLAHDLFVAFADLALKLLAGYHLFVFCELVFHLLTFEEMNVLLEEQRNIRKDFVDSGSTFREEGKWTHI